jgi:hypothetical protein
MKKMKLHLMLLSFLIAGLAASGYAQVAKLQIIHNSSDQLVENVDIFVNGAEFLTNVGYRQATGYLEVPAGVDLSIVVAPAGAGIASGTEATDVNLQENTSYIVVASGIVSETGYQPATPFSLELYQGARETASQEDEVDILVYHGVTDAPAVNVTARNIATVVTGAAYTDFSDYISVPEGFYVLDISANAAPDDVITSFGADLRNIAGSSLVVLASGFLDNTVNNNGSEFTLIAVLADGTVIELPGVMDFEGMLSGLAEVPANPSEGTGTFNVVLSGNVLQLYGDFSDLSNPFTGAHIHRGEAGVNGGVAHGLTTELSNENLSGQWEASENVFTMEQDDIDLLMAGDLYVNVHSQLLPAGEIRGQILSSPNVAPTASSITSPEDGAAIVIEGSSSTPFVPAWEQATDDDGDKIVYIWQLSPTADFDTVLVYQSTGDQTQFESNYGTVDAILTAAGVPTGSEVTVYHRVVTSDGSNLTYGEASSVVITRGELDATARVQIIHNAADLAAANVDIYANDILLLPNFAFRSATPFVDLPAGVEIKVDVVPAGSPLSASVGTFMVNLDDGQTYVIIANGIVSTTGYAPAVDFALYPFSPARETASDPGKIDVLVFHGATDAPTVSVWETGVGAGELFTFSYGEFAGYLSLDPADYVLEVRTETGETTVATFGAPLETLQIAGQAITVLASGFLNPAENSQGPAFGLYAATAQGGNLIPLSAVATNVSENRTPVAALSVYPNPARDLLNISFELNGTENVTFELYNILGVQVRKMESDKAGNVSHTINVSDLPQGTYILNVRTPGEVQSKRINIVK